MGFFMQSNEKATEHFTSGGYERLALAKTDRVIHLMQTLRTKALIIFFWLPIAISVFLDPGSGYKNVATFSQFELSLLLLCGIAMLAGCLLHILKPTAFSRWYETKTNYAVFFAHVLFAGFFGMSNIYTAAIELMSK
jgi:hypothetical protein